MRTRYRFKAGRWPGCAHCEGTEGHWWAPNTYRCGECWGSSHVRFRRRNDRGREVWAWAEAYDARQDKMEVMRSALERAGIGQLVSG